MAAMDKTAFTFPGQGRVVTAVAAPWADDPAGWPFARASERLGWDVLAAIEAGAVVLSDTRKAQPAIYTHSAACCLLARAEGLRPDVVAGHSLGEYAALLAAGGSASTPGWTWSSSAPSWPGRRAAMGACGSSSACRTLSCAICAAWCAARWGGSLWPTPTAQARW